MIAHLLLSLLLSSDVSAGAPAPGPEANVAARPQLPVSFTRNEGQFAEGVEFVARCRDASFALTRTGVTCRFNDSQSVQVLFEGASPGCRLVGEGVQRHRSHYYYGDDPEQWHGDVANFDAVRYIGLYEGVDLLYRGDGARLKYEFVVRPGADASVIRVRYEGARNVRVGERGELLVDTGQRELVEEPPYVFQLQDGEEHPVEACYVVDGGSFGFQVSGDYREDLPLIIDPVLDYSTYLGGSMNDVLLDNAVDDAGKVYLIGYTSSPDFPAAGGPVPSSGSISVFVTCLLADGSGADYSVFLGGSGSQLGYGIDVDASGSAYLAGHTNSLDFPTTAGAFDTTFNSLPTFKNDLFVAQLSPTGALVYGSYLGGTDTEITAFSGGIRVDGAGSVYVLGHSDSADYPTTPGCYDATFNGLPDIVVTKMTFSGGGASDLLYSTFVGGSEYEEAGEIEVLDGAVYACCATRSGDFPAAGGPPFNGTFDAVVFKLNPLGGGTTDLVYGTRLGGSNHDYAISMIPDCHHNAFVVGVTYSSDFTVTSGAYQPTSGGGQDAFVAKLDPAGNVLASSYLGDTGHERCQDVALNGPHPVVVGYTASNNFPVTVGSVDTSHNGDNDIFVAELDSALGALVFSTFFGGSDDDFGRAIDTDSAGNWYVAGTTQSGDYPTTTGCFDSSFNGPANDGYAFKLVVPDALECGDLEPGLTTCPGDGSGTTCPCGNVSAVSLTGCVHSGGVGIHISGRGSTSIAADDLTITVADLPHGNSGIFYSGTVSLDPGSPLFDGLQCVGGNVRRYGGLWQADGTAEDTSFVAQAGHGYFAPGITYYFQFWTRDVAAPSPCGTGANFSPAYAVQMTP